MSNNNNISGVSLVGTGAMSITGPNNGQVSNIYNPNHHISQAGMQHPGLGGGILIGPGGINSVHAQSQQRSPWALDVEFPTHLFKAGEPLYTGLVGANNENVHFYLNLWIACEKPEPSTYGIIETTSKLDFNSFTTSSNLILLFADQQHADKFLDWHKRYAMRFGADTWHTKRFPTISAGMQIKGHAYPAAQDPKFSITIGETQSVEFEEWKWIVQRTYDKVLSVNGFWIFENETEMVMFKMRDKE